MLVIRVEPAAKDVAASTGTGTAHTLVIKEGVLRKNANGKSTKKTMLGSMRQKMGDSWKDRYFCLTADRFEYFPFKGAPKPKGGVDVDNINGVEVFSGGRGTGFEVHCNIMSDGSVDADGSSFLLSSVSFLLSPLFFLLFLSLFSPLFLSSRLSFSFPFLFSLPSFSPSPIFLIFVLLFRTSHSCHGASL